MCDRVAILNTTLRTVGRPDELRERLFEQSLAVTTVAPLRSPERVFARPRRRGLATADAGGYVLAVSDPRAAAPDADQGARRRGRRRTLDRRAATLARRRVPGADRRGRGGEAPVRIDSGRVRAVVRKELRQFRRNRAIVVTMGCCRVLFLTGPMINLFSLSASAAARRTCTAWSGRCSC